MKAKGCTLTIKDKVWPQANRQPSLHHKGNEPIQFAIFPSIHPFHVSTMNEFVDESGNTTRKVEGYRSGYMLPETPRRNYLRPSVHNKVRRILIRCFESQLFEERSLIFSQVRRKPMDAHCEKEERWGCDPISKCRIPLYSTCDGRM